MNEQNDKLKEEELLGEIRELGHEIDEPILVQYLNLSLDAHVPTRKILIPLSEIEELDHLKYLKPKHKALVPLLLKYLHEFQTENYKESVVRALGVKGFNEATEALVNEFNSTNLSDLYKWSIGDALSIILDGRYEEQYIDIVKNKKHGDSRQMIAITLGKIKSKKALPFLLSLLNDEDLNGHVVMALGYYKNPELIKYIEPFLKHKKAWIRHEAKRSIEKIIKANKK